MININRIKKIIRSFSKMKILVLGDFMLDVFIWGKVNRISPEAPVPVVNVQKKSYMPGGAVNVAANISSLGGKCILAGVVGADRYGQRLLQEAKKIKTIK